jgi:hypothetical protein
MLMTNEKKRVKLNVDKENKQYQSWRKKEKKRTEQTLGIFSNQPILVCLFFFDHLVFII